ncbi:MAG TPA: hypothetical protein VGV36_03760 [Solirubrobacteraceae bacterium]|nr:hypothetical protein [Solirubrobacteraceae bacterium]
MLAAPLREEEWAKTLLSVVMAGASFVVLDEAGELRSPALAAALTAPVFEGRVLGRSENVQLPQRATWAAAGNNIRLGGDLARRCYWIRLDAKTARPWQRDGFRHADLLAWAATRRTDLLAALLTLARAWYADKCPPAPDAPTLGGFNAWAHTIGGILHNAGIPAFLGNLEHLYAQADEEAAAWEAFLAAWQRHYGDGPVRVAQLTDDLTTSEELRDALPEDLAMALDRSTASFKAKLGKGLGKRAGTRYGDQGARVERCGQDARSALSSWRVVSDQTAEVAEIAEVWGRGDYADTRGRARGLGDITSTTSAPLQEVAP